MSAAFSDDVLLDRRNSELIELDAETVAVVRVKQHMTSEQLALEAVRADIADRLQFEQAVALADQRAGELVARLEAGELAPAALAEQLGQQWQVREAVSRAERDVHQALLRNVFTMPRPDDAPVYGHYAQPDGSQWIVELRGVAIPEDVVSDEDAPMYGQFVAGQAGEQDFAALRQRLQQEADIERY